VFIGSAPDIGAYEPGITLWRAESNLLRNDGLCVFSNLILVIVLRVVWKIVLLFAIVVD
jgi:hypothetical protein